MARYELLLPKMGESVAEANIVKWLKSPGDMIALDEAVLEIATDKVDSEVPSPVEGKLIERLFNEDETVQVGQAIALIETGGGADAEEEPNEASFDDANKTVFTPENQVQQTEEASIPGLDQLEQRGEDVEKPVASGRFYSPLVRSIASEEGIELAELEQIEGSGADGRLTKDDLLAYIRSRGSAFSPAEPQKPTVPADTEKREVKTAPPAPQPATVSVSGGDEIIEMDRMRRLIAEHMVMSKHTSPHVTSFVEADVTNLVLWRDRIKKEFEKREGEKITFTPIFIEAVARALKDFPMVNVQVKGTQIIKKKNINIGMAAALPSGNLIVPVIKNADHLNLSGLTRAVNDLASRARQSKLKPDETQEGTFTLTNVGSFGNVMGTPIINQPQVAILAVGAIKKKPAVIETEEGDMIAVRHMMFLSLSYDHRVVDGALGGSFVRRVADYLEQWDSNRTF
ncbi:MAG: 2-oxo acid dehydrogenase subunit E2 [Mucilaginibacter polytrichastri]|nr:2-oxo acid dehydrogenase subunit E2 [Mucilaginibacter polytrichastri]